MAQIFSTTFIQVHAGGFGIFLVPNGSVAIVRCITAFNGSVLAPETSAVVVQPTDATIFQVLLSPGDWTTADMRVVLEATQQIQTNNDADIDMTVSGYLLTAP